jgi:ubiquinone biosynthesis protein UbiJ
MIGWLTNKAEREARKFTMAYERGYHAGAKEMAEYVTDKIIAEINEDAVLRTTVDVDTLERVVEVIEGVWDIGKAHS